MLTIIGQPALTGGDFPVSVAVSTAPGLACVGSAGSQSGVSCSRFNPDTGLEGFDSLRPIPLGQSNPPTGPTHGIAQVLFAEEDAKLVAIVKGNGTAGDPGLIAVYSTDVSTSRVTSDPINTSPVGAYFLFGSALIPGTSRILACNAGFGGFIIDLENPHTPLQRQTSQMVKLRAGRLPRP